ncbi:hypothetical protein ES703_76539 [subsurface metagenome]
MFILASYSGGDATLGDDVVVRVILPSLVAKVDIDPGPPVMEVASSDQAIPAIIARAHQNEDLPPHCAAEPPCSHNLHKYYPELRCKFEA